MQLFPPLANERMAAPHEMVKPEKGQDILKIRGFLYWKNSAYRNSAGIEVVYWRCIHWEKGPDGQIESKCPALAKLSQGVAEITIAHNHAGTPVIVERKKYQADVKKKVVLVKGAG